jgi:hypothetical protein
MLDAGILSKTSDLSWSNAILAVGALGTAAYGLVDASKAFWGGISNRGFGDIKKLVQPFFTAGGTGPGLGSALATLRANWMNGMAMSDQKAIAKSLIKLNLTPATASTMAKVAGVNSEVLSNIATKLSAATKEQLTDQESDVFGRFDLALAALLDQGYQRGDQRYRNSAKLAAIPAAVGLAVAGAYAANGGSWVQAFSWRTVVIGLVATPLAPVAKDVASAVQAGAKVAQLWKRV